MGRSGDALRGVVVGARAALLLVGSVGSAARTYDANGNTRTGVAPNLTYDDRNRLASMSRPIRTAQYRLNGRGERVGKAVINSSSPGGTPTTMLYGYDEGGQLLGDYDATGIAQVEYVYLDSQPIAVVKGASLAYVETDHLGTPRQVFDPATNAAKWAWSFFGNAFGAEAPNESPGGGAAYTLNLRFPGQYYDVETGLNYNYFRDYESATGRYVESDPAGLEGGINTYAYARSNPFSYFDALGLKVEVRCRRVGNPTNPDFRSRVAAALGGEHCFVAVSCNGKDGTLMPESTISYLGPVFIATNGSPPNNDTAYSESGDYRTLGVRPPGSDEECPSCELEKCILSKAWQLRASGYSMKNYSIWGPNSNSFARRIVESCGAQVIGEGPLTGWNDGGKTGF